MAFVMAKSISSLVLINDKISCRMLPYSIAFCCFVFHIKLSRWAILMFFIFNVVVSCGIISVSSLLSSVSDNFSDEPNSYSNLPSLYRFFSSKNFIKNDAVLLGKIPSLFLETIPEIIYNCSSARVIATYKIFMSSNNSSCFFCW